MPKIKLPLIISTASIPIVSYGARLRETSPQFDQWLQAMTADMHLVDGAGLGVMLSTWWVFVMFSWIIGIAFFICFFAIGIKLSGNTRINSTKRLIIKALFITALAYPSILLGKGVIEDFRWQFHILGLGEFVTFIALMIGIAKLLAIRPL